MADAKKSLLMMGTLGVILLILVIVFAVALLVGSEFAQQICEQEGGTYTTTCSVQSEAYNSTVELISQISTVVGFIGLVVLTAIGAILIGMAKGFMNQGDL